MAKIWSMYTRAFAGLPRAIWMISLVTLINRAGMMVLPFLTLYFTSEGGLDKDQAAWLLFAFGAGSLTGSYLGGLASARFGSVRVLAFSLFSAGSAFWFFPLLHGFVVWLVACFVLASLADMSRPAMMTAVAENAPKHLQARAFALLRVAIHTGLALGPAAGGLLATIDYKWLFIADGSTCIAAALLVPLVLREAWHKLPQHRTTTSAEPKQSPWRDGPFLTLMLVVLLLAMVIFQFLGTYPLYLHDYYQFSERQIGGIFAVNAVSLALFEMPVVHRFERFNPMLLLGVGSLVLCLGWGLLPLGSTILFAIISMGIFTLGEIFTLPFSNAIVAARAGNATGEYMGVYGTVIALGVMIGPSTGLMIYKWWHPTGFWFSLIGIGVCLLILCRWLQPHFVHDIHHPEEAPPVAESTVATL